MNTWMKALSELLIACWQSDNIINHMLWASFIIICSCEHHLIEIYTIFAEYFHLVTNNIFLFSEKSVWRWFDLKMWTSYWSSISYRMHLILGISILFFSSPVFSFEGKEFFYKFKIICWSFQLVYSFPVFVNTFEIVCNLISVSYWWGHKRR